MSTATRIDDELAADRLRADLRSSPIHAVESDDRIGPLLEGDEVVIARREAVRVERHGEVGGADEVAGDLYVTSRRLALIGGDPLCWMLGDISEAVIVSERVMLLTTSGSGVSIAVDRPRELRVIIAAARTGRIDA